MCEKENTGLNMSSVFSFLYDISYGPINSDAVKRGMIHGKIKSQHDYAPFTSESYLTDKVIEALAVLQTEFFSQSVAVAVHAVGAY